MFDSAGVHHRHPVRHRQSLILIMRDENGRRADSFQEAAQFDLHRLAQTMVERAQSLVEQEHARFDRQRQRHALLLTARERPHGSVRIRGHLHKFEGSLNLGRDRVSRQAAPLQAEADIATNGQVGKQRIALEHHADIPLVRRRPGDIHSGDRDRTFVGGGEAGNQSQQSGLATPGRAEQCD